MTYYNTGRMSASPHSSSLGNTSHRQPLFVDAARPMVEYKRFGQEYFSGCDVKIFFDDILVDTVMNISYDIKENIAPIYGYKSYTFDAVARGARMIRGSFTIAFKEAYYLHAIADSIEYKRQQGTTKRKPFEFTDTYAENAIESVLATAGDAQSFEALADAYEAAMWGEGDVAFIQRGTEQAYNTYFNPNDKQPYLDSYGYTIMITFGNIDRESGIGLEGKDPMHPHSTVETLIGVQLTSVSKRIDISGQPIMEVYDFIAQDVNRAPIIK